ncbi:MAG: inositol monophosphatase family protein [Alphaproteobacteria bacterium]|nr:inositol monophosphatase family protein [Alphaproteobacteria bacterium]
MAAPAVSQEFIEFAHRLADEAGKILLPASASRPGIELKPDRSYVTAIDKKIEAHLRTLIADRYPAHGIHGEEHGDERLDSDHVWVLDPIDGTAPFIAGMPVFGTLISLLRDGVPILGIIDHPVTRDRWFGAVGHATTRNGQACRTRACPSLADAIMTTSNPDFYPVHERPAYEALRERTQWRIYGGSCFSYGLMASGRTDVAIDTGFSIHDYAPYKPILEGAGGVVTDWEGRPITFETGHRILSAGDPARHRDALAVVRDVMKS